MRATLDLRQAARTKVAGKVSHPLLALRPIHDSNGIAVMIRRLLVILAACACQSLPMAAQARSPFDGQWNITFATQSGNCSPTYNFAVDIENGVITSPSAETFRGNVTGSGAVRASVAVQDKRASGSGKLKGVQGRGSWIGWSGDQRCMGSWTAQRAW